jgi:hypothetical protein
MVTGFMGPRVLSGGERKACLFKSDQAITAQRARSSLAIELSLLTAEINV